MVDKLANPFDITKAVDFSDKQINDYWVDFPNTGFMEMVKPTSSMPMFILGGKGSGKTHLMRYYSYSAQKIRIKEDVVEGIKKDGYLAIYLRCGGLNATRFSHNKDNINWQLLFAYYMDLWLSQLVLMVIKDAVNDCSEFLDCEGKICKEVFELIAFPDESDRAPEKIDDLIFTLHNHQRKLDLAINNYSFSPEAINSINILAAPGKLIFAIPQIISNNFESFSQVKFLYLIDELENLTEEQQKYVNTIVREKEEPCSFKIGARRYGIKTFATYSANEINIEGSEYELLHLDEQLRNFSSKKYSDFSKALCLRRLRESGHIAFGSKDIEGDVKNIESFFEVDEKSEFSTHILSFIDENIQGSTRPYIDRLKKQLMMKGWRSDEHKSLSLEDIDTIITLLSCKDYPLIEKANLFLFYQDWSSKKNLLESAKYISEECQKYIDNPQYKCLQKKRLKHFKADLYAQLLQDCGLKQKYLGVPAFIGMSAGLPRNLLIIMKHIYQWSVFNDEHPFKDGSKITESSQREGILEASDWFFRDAKIIEKNGALIQDSINRLATLFKEIRFADKPSECSLSTFSVDISLVSPKAREIIDAAEDRSFLIGISKGQKDRNTRRVDAKFQLNPMLAPRWDLPVHRRGAIALNAEEVNSIFDPEYSELFDEIARKRVERMTAPSFGKKDSLAENKAKQKQFIQSELSL